MIDSNYQLLQCKQSTLPIELITKKGTKKKNVYFYTFSVNHVIYFLIDTASTTIGILP